MTFQHEPQHLCTAAILEGAGRETDTVRWYKERSWRQNFDEETKEVVKGMKDAVLG